MTREQSINEVFGWDMNVEEVAFRIARGCDRCGFYLPIGEDGKYCCMEPKKEDYCRADHEKWLAGEMDV